MNIIVHCSIADINFTNVNFLEDAIFCYTLCTCECVVSCFIYVLRTVYYILICCVLVWLTVLYHTHCTYVCLS